MIAALLETRATKSSQTIRGVAEAEDNTVVGAQTKQELFINS
jgi:hypothetical protein